MNENKNVSIQYMHVWVYSHLQVEDEVFSETLWNGYLKSNLFPLLPELTSITLMGLVFSPVCCQLVSERFPITFVSESTDHCLYIIKLYKYKYIC